MNMNCKFSFLGVIFGLIMARKPEISSLHALFAFVSLFAMMYLENWASIKMVDRKEIHGIIRGCVFLYMALLAASLYINILNMEFFIVAFAGALFAIGLVYFPTRFSK